jgi:molybdate transport system substrate-binding protein
MAIRQTLRLRLRFLTGLLCLLAAAGLPAREAAPGSAALPQPSLLVFAAASLTDALEEADRAFTADSHIAVKTSYAGSSVLAKQIEAGARADVFVSADREWMDYLEKHGLLRPGTRRDLLGNALVLIAPADSPVQLKIAPQFALAAALGSGRLACADPDSVPAGLYARAALTALGVWEAVSPRLARAENVRAALAYVARGEAPLGIVYQTDALADKHVRVVDVFPADTHPPIIYPAAATSAARPESARYLDFLRSERARQIFTRYGFSAPAP